MTATVCRRAPARPHPLFCCQTANAPQPTLRRPYCLVGPGQALVAFRVRRSRIRTEGARDAVGSGRTEVHASVRKLKVLRPTGLDASRHRGLSKLIVPQVRQSLGVPRAVFGRFAPHRPRWTYLSGDPASPFELAGRLSTAVGPGRRCGPVTGCNATPSRGPVDARLARRDEAAWTAGSGKLSAASPTPPNRPPLPAPRLETADPSVTRAGWMGI